METPAFLKPIQSYPGEIVQFIERIPGVDVTGDRETVLERLEPYHKAEVEALGWRWKDLRRAEQVHGTKVALVGDIGSNYPVEGVDGLICSAYCPTPELGFGIWTIQQSRPLTVLAASSRTIFAWGQYR